MSASDELAHRVCGALGHMLEIAAREGWAAVESYAGNLLEEQLREYEVALFGADRADELRKQRAGLRR